MELVSKDDQEFPLKRFCIFSMRSFQTTGHCHRDTKMLQSHRLQCGWAEQWSQSRYFSTGNTGRQLKKT